jgi:predicted GNAT family N-acyltransferase
MKQLKIISIQYPHAFAPVMEIRQKVFIEEQKISAALELDGHDHESKHFLAQLNGLPVATGRLRLKGFYCKFERIATLREFRGRGIGRTLMQFMQDDATRNYPTHLPAMHAQQTAISFYTLLRWIPLGEIFEEASIPHQLLIYPPQQKSTVENLIFWKNPEINLELKTFLSRYLNSLT